MDCDILRKTLEKTRYLNITTNMLGKILTHHTLQSVVIPANKIIRFCFHSEICQKAVFCHFSSRLFELLIYVKVFLKPYYKSSLTIIDLRIKLRLFLNMRFHIVYYVTESLFQAV